MGNVILIILDGWGLSRKRKGNAIFWAKTPNFDYFWKNFPKTKLLAHGKWVGLPSQQEGNSEAGHLNLGTGRIILQDAVDISKSINDGTFFKNPAFKIALGEVKKYKSRLHLMGLLSNHSTSHSIPEHLYALLKLAKKEKIEKVILHLFTDGRDSSPHGAIEFLRKLRRHLKNHRLFYQIGSLVGRYYAMDRRKYWENTEKTYNLLTLGEGEKAQSPEEAIVKAYNRNLTDEHVPPTIIETKDSTPIILEKDSVIFFNLRSDRARQITKTFVQDDFEKRNSESFKRKKILKNIKFVALTDFGPDLPHILTAYPSKIVVNSLPFLFKNFSQVYIAEAEKYAHVTYFFNGGYADPISGEERIKIPSLNIAHYEEKPEMSIFEVTKVVKKYLSKKYNFICINFANPDIIGHTGNFEAGIKCCAIVDRCLGEIVGTALKNDFSALVVGDHGNIEEMINLKTGEVNTKHSKNPVPFILIPSAKLKKRFKKIRLKKGILANVAPTILKIMEIPKPKEMTKTSLF